MDLTGTHSTSSTADKKKAGKQPQSSKEKTTSSLDRGDNEDSTKNWSRLDLHERTGCIREINSVHVREDKGFSRQTKDAQASAVPKDNSAKKRKERAKPKPPAPLGMSFMAIAAPRISRSVTTPSVEHDTSVSVNDRLSSAKASPRRKAEVGDAVKKAKRRSVLVRETQRSRESIPTDSTSDATLSREEHQEDGGGDCLKKPTSSMSAPKKKKKGVCQCGFAAQAAEPKPVRKVTPPSVRREPKKPKSQQVNKKKTDCPTGSSGKRSCPGCALCSILGDFDKPPHRLRLTAKKSPRRRKEQITHELLKMPKAHPLAVATRPTKKASPKRAGGLFPKRLGSTNKQSLSEQIVSLVRKIVTSEMSRCSVKVKSGTPSKSSSEEVQSTVPEVATPQAAIVSAGGDQLLVKAVDNLRQTAPEGVTRVEGPKTPQPQYPAGTFEGVPVEFLKMMARAFAPRTNGILNEQEKPAVLTVLENRRISQVYPLQKTPAGPEDAEPWLKLLPATGELIRPDCLFMAFLQSQQDYAKACGEPLITSDTGCPSQAQELQKVLNTATDSDAPVRDAETQTTIDIEKNIYGKLKYQNHVRDFLGLAVFPLIAVAAIRLIPPVTHRGG